MDGRWKEKKRKKRRMEVIEEKKRRIENGIRKKKKIGKENRKIGLKDWEKIMILREIEDIRSEKRNEELIWFLMKRRYGELKKYEEWRERRMSIGWKEIIKVKDDGGEDRKGKLRSKNEKKKN